MSRAEEVKGADIRKRLEREARHKRMQNGERWLISHEASSDVVQMVDTEWLLLEQIVSVFTPI